MARDCEEPAPVESGELLKTLQEESEAEQRRMQLRLNLDHTVPASATVVQEPGSVAMAGKKNKLHANMSEREPRVEQLKASRVRKFTIN